ncbi:hypothetical protein [Rhodoplanes sp. Z2-YC6860]|uniref:hypothetical protein n=1 Tax=Rhodoplanes sp. Z2-YC6860 TaxID=674703 RepID=UPI000829FB40|nr:hypothetical protein [Rhodoplanes sp. Z2-YC6860]
MSNPVPYRAPAGPRRTSPPWIRLIAIAQTMAARVSRASDCARVDRAAVERELFGGLYTYSSKNDDDLPAVGLAVHGRNSSGL